MPTTLKKLNKLSLELYDLQTIYNKLNYTTVHCELCIRNGGYYNTRHHKHYGYLIGLRPRTPIK